MKLGMWMKLIRLRSDIKQKELASSLGVSASTLCSYEQGKRKPPISFLGEYCKYFNLRIVDFFRLISNDLGTRSEINILDCVEVGGKS